LKEKGVGALPIHATTPLVGIPLKWDVGNLRLTVLGFTMFNPTYSGIAEKRDDEELCSQSSRPVFIPRGSLDGRGVALGEFTGVGGGAGG